MRVLMLEFNELTPHLMDQFIAAGELPNFAKLRNRSLNFTTDAQEEPPFLEPWIQWVTVHTGHSYAEHKCFKLNDGNRLPTRRLWDHCGAQGRTSWVCGSMNAGFDPEVFKGHFLADPWATDASDFPAGAFKPYLDVVRAFVQEHSGKPRVSALEMARFGSFMLANGLNVDTMGAAVRQLLNEQRAPTKWRRALILDRLQWDLFRGLYRKNQPDFATFFLNSTAHFQHFHWREMEPDLFKIKPRVDEVSNFGDAILDGYRSMDRIVGQALSLAGDDTAIVLCTALSQQPMLTYEDDAGRQIFRHRDISQLLSFAGVEDDCEYAPVMSQEFMLHCHNEDEAIAVAKKLSGLTLEDGRPVMWAAPIGDKINAGCKINSDPGQMIIRSEGSDYTAKFPELFYPLEALRSGMHDPLGIFWIKAPGYEANRIDAPVPLTSVFPTLMDLIGLQDECDSAPSLLPNQLSGEVARAIA